MKTLLMNLKLIKIPMFIKFDSILNFIISWYLPLMLIFCGIAFLWSMFIHRTAYNKGNLYGQEMKKRATIYFLFGALIVFAMAIAMFVFKEKILSLGNLMKVLIIFGTIIIRTIIIGITNRVNIANDPFIKGSFIK